MVPKILLSRRNLLAASLLACITTAGGAYIHHERGPAYPLRRSSLSNAVDFSLGDEQTYFDTLKSTGEHLLLFWASWCPHCEALIEKELSSKNRATFLRNLFTVSIDSRTSDVEKHARDFPVYLDNDETVYDVFRLSHIPALFVVDATGSIQAAAEGEADCQRILAIYYERNRSPPSSSRAHAINPIELEKRHV